MRQLQATRRRRCKAPECERFHAVNLLRDELHGDLVALVKSNRAARTDSALRVEGAFH